MENINTDQQRDELHRAIWAIADELRGSVDGWDFKSYVLGMMFYQYISDRDGVLKTTGTDVDKILPPVSRFGGRGSRDKKKQNMINKLRNFFERYFGVL